ncbi:PPM family protein phosphatase [Gammaproteobacteria bacterium]
MDLRPPLFWSSASRTDTGKVRSHNEDACLELPARGLWAVADGMGGHEAGEVASTAIVSTLGEIRRPPTLRSFVDEVEDRLLACNAQLRRLANSRGRNQIIGATVVVLLTYGKLAVYLWAGDCRLYRCRQGNLVQLTQDHTQVEEMVTRGLLARADTRRHPNANVVTRAVGARDAVFLDVDAEPVEIGDRFLLCSDGLDKELEDNEIRDILVDGEDTEVVNTLIDLALSRKGRDNITVVAATAHLATNQPGG